ncbi:MAG: metallophosphoesterase [Candidatus Bathyarchaeota archaeon]|nr:metallophosphoesterase [Candidatus Bathyarchaeota archaeon]
MLIGLISDTHDNLAMVEKAIERFNSEKVELVLHAGDYVSPFVIPKFKTLKCRLIGVFGNNDGDHEFLRRRFVEAGNCELRGRFAEITVDGFKIALLHGDETDLLNALFACDCFDAVVYGHVHTLTIRRNSKKLIINPGEACGYLTGKPTVGLLDTKHREAKIIDL